MKKLSAIIISVFAVVGLVALPLAVASTAQAQPAKSIQEGVNGIGGNESQPELEDGIKDIVNVLLFILGAIAVIMIIIGGIRYTTSNGDASNIKAAKDTILYAVIGLIVAILAYAIVNFVVGAFVGGN
jgi:magnesium-transporting ATPase (P-type)